MTNLLLDTNLLIYAIDEDSKYFHSVHKLLNDDSLNLFTTSKNVSEFLSVITRYPDKSISIKDALLVVEEFKHILTFLYQTEESYSIFMELLRNYSPRGLKIHDFEIISIALSHKLKKIATANEKDFAGVQEIELFSIK